MTERFYGDGGTIHNTDHVDVEVHEGRVVAVWFRCQPLRFKQSDWGPQRAEEMIEMYRDRQPPELVPQASGRRPLAGPSGGAPGARFHPFLPRTPSPRPASLAGIRSMATASRRGIPDRRRTSVVADTGAAPPFPPLPRRPAAPGVVPLR